MHLGRRGSCVPQTLRPFCRRSKLLPLPRDSSFEDTETCDKLRRSKKAMLAVGVARSSAVLWIGCNRTKEERWVTPHFDRSC